MVSIRFSRLVLGLLLAFGTLKEDESMTLLAHTHQEVETMANRNGFVAFGVESASINQGRERDATSMGPTNGWHKWRKMMMMEKIKEEDVKRDDSKIAGNGNHASEKSYGRPGTNLNDEIGRKMSKPAESLNHVEKGTIGSSRGPQNLAGTQQLKSQLPEASSAQGSLKSSSNSKAPLSQVPLDDTTEATESKNLLEASMDTMMNMLSMDYNRTPRHKPPINNDLPLSGKLTKP